jgi:predicted PurR-regulated permease PerM
MKPMPILAPKSSSAAALIGIWTILLVVFIITVLYVGRDLLVPLALAALFTFLLTPIVGQLERFIGRIAAVLIIVSNAFRGAGRGGLAFDQPGNRSGRQVA